MNRLEPKHKEQRKVPIPEDLRASLAEVQTLVEESISDPDIDLDFDDAIQVGSLCGGRYGTKERPYVLTYYPKNGAKGEQWVLTLHATEIEDIADGVKAEIVLYCCINLTCHCKFREADEHCSQCDYVEDPELGSFTFPHAIERLLHRGVVGITKESSRSDVMKLLGTPESSGGDLVHPPLGYIWPWIRYRRDDCLIHFEFDKKERIRKVTIMEKDWKPGQ